MPSILRLLLCLFLLQSTLPLLQAADVTPVEAIHKAGKTATVVGVAEEVTFHEDKIYLNFGAKFPNNTFVAIIEKQDAKDSDAAKLRAMEGKEVRVTGKVEMYQNKPVIYLTRRGQLSLAK